MAAYVIAEVKVTDDYWFADYGKKTQQLVEKHGGRCLVRAAPAEKFEGERALPSVVVILEFPSVAQAKGWYTDQEYAPLITLRQTGSKTEITLVEDS